MDREPDFTSVVVGESDRSARAGERTLACVRVVRSVDFEVTAGVLFEDLFGGKHRIVREMLYRR